MTGKRQEKPQIDKFREAARELETDDDEARFDATLKRIAKAPPSKGHGKPPPSVENND
ncbi:hypothetical protein [Aurantimonas marina]|uniref:hypothetical protein n=1 Tax=Aurantimonas marina TaxID=2780508 RepID=UPI0019D084FA|nr:hypothetical protein [Aurantimonas marina]